MVKQINTGGIVDKVLKDFKGYFHWLQQQSGLTGPLSSMLAETSFVSVDGLDDILVEKTKEEVRRKYAEEIAEEEDLNDKETEALYKSIRGDVCLFEVITCLAFSLNEMFEDSSAFDGPSHFFGVMMHNAGFDIYDEEDWDMDEKRVRESWEKRIKLILGREYNYYGVGGLFPLVPCDDPCEDQRKVSLWQQMNNWVDQHTDEDGEWVD